MDKHNELRRKVAKGQETQGSNGAQPAASNMKEMVYILIIDYYRYLIIDY